jgi:hypothetical protein
MNCPPSIPTPSPCPAPAPAGATWSLRHGRLPWPGPRPGHPPGRGGLPRRAGHRLLWGRGAERQLRSAPGGHGADHRWPRPAPGRALPQPGVGPHPARVAEGGKEAFYQGEIAEAIAAVVQAAGGCMAVRPGRSSQHLGRADQHAYRGLRVWECPPNGQGLAALLASTPGGLRPGLPPAPLAARAAPHDRGHAPGLCRCPLVRRRPGLQPRPAGRAALPGYAAERRRLIDPPARPSTGNAARPGRLGHRLLQRRRRRGQCLLVHQQQLHGLRHRHRPLRLGLHPAEPRPQLQPRPGPPQRPRARQAPLPHHHPRPTGRLPGDARLLRRALSR